MDESTFNPGSTLGPQVVPTNPIRVLLLDDREENLGPRSAILRQKGYRVVTSSSIEEAESKLGAIDIAVLDYHLGAGKFGTDVAETLRRKRPQVPIIILSATLERKFGGIADMHLLKGYSSVDDLVNALRSFEAKKRGRPVWLTRAISTTRAFRWQSAKTSFSRFWIATATGSSSTTTSRRLPGTNAPGLWGNLFEQFPQLGDEWREIVRTVADTREILHSPPRFSWRFTPACRKSALELERSHLSHQAPRRPRWRRPHGKVDREEVAELGDTHWNQTRCSLRRSGGNALAMTSRTVFISPSRSTKFCGWIGDETAPWQFQDARRNGFWANSRMSQGL